ncbi:hypothetical protein PanWU01x14_279690 [Parasponia andersonii]|uniref:Uncharacterized protein n=1 Tax=Parasponia andersonii TaxID=3476 RepID=A0A2P5B1U0_PARAD|nr:hypothetical protein PanWU01x14_279690 [Parasponia andersonii]
MTSRSTRYSVREDVILTQVYLDISQDPITGRYQSVTTLWSHMEQKYKEARNGFGEYCNLQFSNEDYNC